jgi:hypothetical protein
MAVPMIADIEDLLISALSATLSQFEVLVMACPNDLVDLARPTRNRVIVQFKRISYDIPKQTNITGPINQIGYLRYEIITQFRGLRTHLRCLDIVECIYQTITGIIPNDNLPYFFYQIDGSFVDFIDGFWIYRSVFEVKVLAVSREK